MTSIRVVLFSSTLSCICLIKKQSYFKNSSNKNKISLHFLQSSWGRLGLTEPFQSHQSSRSEPAGEQSVLLKLPTTGSERSPLPLEGSLGHTLLRILIHPKVVKEINLFSLLLRHTVKNILGLNRCNSIQFNYILSINLVLLLFEAAIWHFVVYFCYCFFFLNLPQKL